MYIHIALPEVSLDQQVALLRVVSAEHQIVLRRHEPREALKPFRAPYRPHSGGLLLHLGQLLCSALLSGCECTCIGFHRASLLGGVALAGLVAHPRVGRGVETQVHFHPGGGGQLCIVVRVRLQVQLVSEQQRRGIALQVQRCHCGRHRVARRLFRLDEGSELSPVQAARQSSIEGIDGSIHYVQIVLYERCLVLLKVGLPAEGLSAGLLVGTRLVQLAEHRPLGLRLLHIRPLPLHLGVELVQGGVEGGEGAGGAPLLLHQLQRLVVVVHQVRLVLGGRRRLRRLCRLCRRGCCGALLAALSWLGEADVAGGRGAVQGGDPVLEAGDGGQQRLQLRGGGGRLGRPGQGGKPRLQQAVVRHLGAKRQYAGDRPSQRGTLGGVPEGGGEGVSGDGGGQSDGGQRVGVAGHSGHTPRIVPVRPQQRQHLVPPVRQDHITRGVKFEDEMHGGRPSTEREINDAVHTKLSHILQPPRAHVLSQLETEVAGLRRALLQHLGCMEPRAGLQQEVDLLAFLAAARQLQQVCLWVEVVYVCHPHAQTPLSQACHLCSDVSCAEPLLHGNELNGSSATISSKPCPR
mmetsp:Transcript_12131/g.36449  ORF Transcript_12131/g.36449 Transcript_12131/m.36449 type:complete len:577 (+) Transcript_12131:878-2608(+)